MKIIEQIRNDLVNGKSFRYEENGIIIAGEPNKYDDYDVYGEYDKYGMTVIFEDALCDIDETLEQIELFLTDPLDYSYHRYNYCFQMSFEEYSGLLNGKDWDDYKDDYDSLSEEEDL